jgi:hypothetical protein
MNGRKTHRYGLVTLILLVALLAANPVAWAASGKGNDNPGVLPLNADALQELRGVVRRVVAVGLLAPRAASGRPPASPLRSNRRGL